MPAMNTLLRRIPAAAAWVAALLLAPVALAQPTVSVTAPLVGSVVTVWHYPQMPFQEAVPLSPKFSLRSPRCRPPGLVWRQLSARIQPIRMESCGYPLPLETTQ
jgi:hypothetical protein